MKSKEIKLYKKQLIALSLTMSVGKVIQLHENIVAKLREDGLEEYACRAEKIRFFPQLETADANRDNIIQFAVQNGVNSLVTLLDELLTEKKDRLNLWLWGISIGLSIIAIAISIGLWLIDKLC
jgi:hypothetical protein